VSGWRFRQRNGITVERRRECGASSRAPPRHSAAKTIPDQNMFFNERSILQTIQKIHKIDNQRRKNVHASNRLQQRGQQAIRRMLFRFQRGFQPRARRALLVSGPMDASFICGNFFSSFGRSKRA